MMPKLFRLSYIIAPPFNGFYTGFISICSVVSCKFNTARGIPLSEIMAKTAAIDCDGSRIEGKKIAGDTPAIQY
ncbi:hypothetical protein YERSI8AC_260104 [Enterobacterales bacterium 8AC]|nr:hypothetical protein YERSI8AC_260104 [Enterobacterales bacterium 8AC]